MVENLKSSNQKKKVLACVVTVLFLTAILAQTTQVNVAWASPTAVYVDPPVTKDGSYIPSSYFAMAMTVDYVELLWGYQVEMTFNPQVLHGVSVDDSGFLGSAGGTVLVAPGQGFDNVNGRLSLFGAFLFEKDPLYLPIGGGPLVIITFEVVGIGASPLVFGSDTGLANSTGGWWLGPDWVPIHKVENPSIFADGYFDNRYPAAVFIYSPDVPFVGEAVTFNASDSYDLDGTIVSYDWDFGDDSTGTGVTPTHSYSSFGSYKVNLTVTDNDGLVDSQSVWVYVYAAPAVSFTYSPLTPVVAETVTFDASGSYDPDGTIVSYVWDFGDTFSDSGQIVTHAYSTAGTYTVNLTVTDDDELANSTLVQLKIRMLPGSPWADFTYSPTAPLVAETVTFDASGSYDPDGTIVSYLWDFGDSFTGSGEVVTHAYSVSGTHTVNLTVVDNDGLIDTALKQITVYLDETPPVANAGPDQTVNQYTLVSFDGSASSDNVGVVSYVWKFTDGTLQTLTGSNPTYNFTMPGIFVVTLNVTDAAGNWDTSTVNITVLDITVPVADAGPDQTVNESTEVTFDGSGSTDNVGITSYQWTFVDVTPKTLTGEKPKYTFATLGVYVVTLNVSDAAGNWDTDEVVITVLDETPPVANAGPDQTVDQGTEVTFDGSGSTDNVGVTGYAWTFDDVTPQTLSGANPKYTFANPGVFVVTLNVTDAAGNWATDTVTITVHDVTKPLANAGSDQTVNEDALVTFDGSGSSDNVGIVSYTWKFTDGTAKTLTGVNPTYTFNTPGVFTVTLNVTDAAGNWATDTVVITVRDVTKPGADAGSDQTADVGAVVSFDGGGSTDNVGIVTYSWDFDDGTTGTGKTVTHSYSDSGIYTVTLTVRDAAGNTSTDATTVTVSAPSAGFPIWIAAAIIVIAILAVAIFVFMRRR